MQDALEKSRRVRREAERLLEASKLLEHLQSFGTPHLTGSYVYDLMAEPDIDIYVVSESADYDHALTLHQSLITEQWWNTYMFADWTNSKFRTAKWEWLPYGYYLRLRNDFGKHRWNIDLWVLQPTEFEHIKTREIDPSTLSERQRLEIIRRKFEKLDTKMPFDSQQIYQEVLSSAR